MRFQFRPGWLLALIAALCLAFCLGRLSVSTPPPQIVSSVATPVAEHETASQSNLKNISAPTASASPPPAVTVGDWENHWRELAARPGSRLRDDEILIAIEDLALRDPARALSLAEAESNLRLRHEMYRAALRGWARVAPEAAADWALSDQTAIERTDALAAALAGAAKTNSDAALKLTAYLIEKDPQHARDHGVSLIAALAGTGEFERAARFAATGDVNTQEDWLTTAYSMWADYQPGAAMTAVAALIDPEARRNAFNAAVSSWSSNDPKAVAEYAAQLDSSDEKKFAITAALRNWAANDAVEAANWIRQRDPSPELDAGTAGVATDQQNFRQPAVAIEWAESITDPELRSSTLVTIIRQWAEQDRAAAQNYFRNSTGLRPNDRSELLADFEATKTQ
jgi:hypothetical protein